MPWNFPPAECVVYSKNNQVAEHQQRIPCHPKLAFWHLCPVDRYLRYDDVLVFRQHENFHVKDPPFQMLVRENMSRRFSRKELEPTLGVPDMTNTDKAKCQV